MMFDLLNNDCLIGMKEIQDAQVDMILCDPPYGTTACKWDSVIPLELLWREFKRLIKPQGAIVIFGSEPFSSTVRASNLEMYKYDWVWHKSTASNFLQANFQPLKVHENIMVFSKSNASQGGEKMNYSPQMEQGKKSKAKNKGQKAKTSAKAWNGRQRGDYIIKSTKKGDSMFPVSIQYFEADRIKLHPTQKPVQLLKYLIKTYTEEGQLILDPTMGSGSTGVAALATKRKFVGIEKDHGIYVNAEDRIRSYMRKLTR